MSKLRTGNPGEQARASHMREGQQVIDFEAIRRAHPLIDIAADMMPLRVSGQEWVACCPFHADRSPSFTIYRGGQRFHCFGCSAKGDVLDFVQRAYGVSLSMAAVMLQAGGVSKAPVSWQVNRSPRNDRDTVAAARAIWQDAISIEGTLAETYLLSRSILGPAPPDIRFAQLPCDNLGRLPCLVAAIRNIAGDLAAIQRIWLTPDGKGKAMVANPKRSLGKVKGGAIRLGELNEASSLIVCEGPEDGLSLRQMTGGAVWASGGTSFLPNMRLPPGLRDVFVAADNDAAGASAAEKAARAFATQGFVTRIIRPLRGFKDFNDELMGVRK